MNFSKRIVFIICLIFAIHTLKANAAQPGIWGAGGHTFTMLYPEDSASFKKVQMQSEQIFVQLYKGFAVVKGVYYFKNHSKDKLSFKMGYPVNGIYSGGDSSLDQMDIDSLSAFKIFANQVPLSIIKEPQENDLGPFQSFSENWHVWQMEFLPEEIQKVEVFFIVSTNNAGVRKGYNMKHYNAFLYLLESGSVWKNPIEKGNFYLQLKDGLTLKEVQGISDGFNFQYNAAQQIFWGSKSNFSPTPKDNLAITYFERIENFDFKSILSQEAKYEAAINQFSKTDFSTMTFEKTDKKNPYEIGSGIWGFLPAVFMFVLYILPWILVGLVLFFIGYKWYKRWKNKKEKL